MGGGMSKKPSAAKPLHKAGLQFPGKDGYVADEFTRWSVILAYESVFERFEVMMDKEKPTERTVVSIQEPLVSEKAAKDPKYNPPSEWNGHKIPTGIEFIKVFLIDYDPTKPKDKENLFVYSFLADKLFEDQIDSYLQAEHRRIGLFK